VVAAAAGGLHAAIGPILSPLSRRYSIRTVSIVATLLIRGHSVTDPPFYALTGPLFTITRVPTGL
jgi:hypothetical protein